MLVRWALQGYDSSEVVRPLKHRFPVQTSFKASKTSNITILLRSMVVSIANMAIPRPSTPPEAPLEVTEISKRSQSSR